MEAVIEGLVRVVIVDIQNWVYDQDALEEGRAADD